jgi:hypothetical protein
VPHGLVEQAASLTRFLRGRIEDAIIKTAWHESGHAVSWALNGGKLKQTTILPKADEFLLGCCTYDLTPDDLSDVDRRRLAFAAMGSHAACELACDLEMHAFDDLEDAVEVLRPLYRSKAELTVGVIETWTSVLSFFGKPRVWRTADAFARLLIARGTIEGFPVECISRDNSPLPGLAEAVAEALGPSRCKHAWWLVYVDEIWTEDGGT